MKNELVQFIIHRDSSLKDALIQMTSTHRGVLLVIDDDFHLVGVLSDGDVRRALVDDVSLNIPITQIMNLNPTVAENQKQALDILGKNPYYILVPVVDPDGKLTGVYSALNGKQFYGNDPLVTSKPATPSNEEKLRFLSVIPARGGSKRIPKKNLAKIGSDTLLSLTIKTAQKSDFIDAITVSTDDMEVAKEAESHGVQVPWLRPAPLADDQAKTVDVMLHSLKMFEESYNYEPEFIILLEPTAPLRSSELIDKAIRFFLKHQNEADSLVSVNQIKHIYHPEEILVSPDAIYLRPYKDGQSFDDRKSRSEQNEVFVQNGLIYITKTNVLKDKKSIYGQKVLKFQTSETFFADIDEQEDLELARMKYNKLFLNN